VLGVTRLQDVAARARANGLDDELPVVVRGQHDDADLREGVADVPSGLEPVHLGHSDVDERDVRLLLLDEVDQLLAVRRFADDLDAVGHVEVAAKALPDQGVIVGDGDAYRHRLAPCRSARDSVILYVGRAGQKM
jgi:hypothetical protein